jgi:choline dehydrogenase-like flavoprotein
MTESRLNRTRYDAIVVGTGFGGAVAACRLAQAGVDVAVLERRAPLPTGKLPAARRTPVLAPRVRRLHPASTTSARSMTCSCCADTTH